MSSFIFLWDILRKKKKKKKKMVKRKRSKLPQYAIGLILKFVITLPGLRYTVLLPVVGTQSGCGTWCILCIVNWLVRWVVE